MFKIAVALFLMISAPAYGFVKFGCPIIETIITNEPTFQGKNGSAIYKGKYLKKNGQIQYALGDHLAIMAIDFRFDENNVAEPDSDRSLCSLSEDLTCSGKNTLVEYDDSKNTKESLFKITVKGIRVDGTLVPWNKNAPTNMSKILEVLKETIKVREARSAGQSSQEQSLLRVRCPSEILDGGVVTFSEVDMFDFETKRFGEKRWELIDICSEPIYQNFLKNAKVGDVVKMDSKLGQCLKAISTAYRWKAAPCSVEKGSPIKTYRRRAAAG